MDLTPKTEAEQGIHCAFTVLLANRDYIGITFTQLLTLCRASPEYAIRFIGANRINFMQLSGSASRL